MRDTEVNYIHYRFGVLKLGAATLSHLFIFLLQGFDFEIIQILFPSITPALSLSIPDFWAWLWISILDPSVVALPIERHVNIEFRQLV